MTREQVLKSPAFVEMMLNVGALVDKGIKCMDNQDTESAVLLLAQAENQANAFMFTDPALHEFFNSDPFMESIVSDLPRYLVGAVYGD